MSKSLLTWLLITLFILWASTLVFALKKHIENKTFGSILHSLNFRLQNAAKDTFPPRKNAYYKFGAVKSFADSADKIAKDFAEKTARFNAERSTFSALLSNMEQGVILLDENKNIILINSAAEEIFNAKDAAGKNILFATRDEKLIKAVSEVETTSTNSLFDFHADGKIYSASIADYADNLATGERRYLLIFTDITLMRSLEKMRSEFFSNASHELKTPLAAIKGFSELAGNSSDLDNIKKYISLITKNTERMTSLLDDMLYLSKIDAKAEEERELINLRALGEDCIATLHAEILDKELSTDIKGNALINASREKMTQLLINLISNAVKYNKYGGKVSLSFEENARRVTIKVSDTGIGIEGTHLSRIFERFYRVDKSRSKKQGGTGLGLSIVKNISLMYNGEVSVKSVKDEGSVFKVILSKSPF